MRGCLTVVRARGRDRPGPQTPRTGPDHGAARPGMGACWAPKCPTRWPSERAAHAALESIMTLPWRWPKPPCEPSCDSRDQGRFGRLAFRAWAARAPGRPRRALSHRGPRAPAPTPCRGPLTARAGPRPAGASPVAPADSGLPPVAACYNAVRARRSAPSALLH
jgi:hypothetical protein